MREHFTSLCWLAVRFDLAGVITILGVASIAGAVFAGAARAARRLAEDGRRESAPRAARTLLTQVALLLAAWLALTGVLAARGAFHTGAERRVPPVAFGLLTPLVVVAAWVSLSRTARRALHVTPQQLLVGAQLYRLVGAVFLLLLAQGRLPPAFALPAGWGDVVVGLTAPLVARRAAARPRGARRLVLAWNVVGITDLLAAVGSGVLTAPGHWQRLAFAHPNVEITRFPFALIPTFLVPMSFLLHAASVRRAITRAAA